MNSTNSQKPRRQTKNSFHTKKDNSNILDVNNPASGGQLNEDKLRQAVIDYIGTRRIICITTDFEVEVGPHEIGNEYIDSYHFRGIADWFKPIGIRFITGISNQQTYIGQDENRPIVLNSKNDLKSLLAIAASSF